MPFGQNRRGAVGDGAMVGAEWPWLDVLAVLQGSVTPRLWGLRSRYNRCRRTCLARKLHGSNALRLASL